MRHSYGSTEEINTLQNCIEELIAFHEGLYPESEMSIAIHRMVRIAQYILKMGPPREWWALPCERAISNLKAFVPKGGTSIELTVFNK